MGHTAEAKCLECGEEFEFKQGNGAEFHLVRCGTCGETKDISLEDLWEGQIRYEKGRIARYFTVAELDKLARKRRGEPISKASIMRALSWPLVAANAKGSTH